MLYNITVLFVKKFILDISAFQNSDNKEAKSRLYMIKNNKKWIYIIFIFVIILLFINLSYASFP